MSEAQPCASAVAAIARAEKHDARSREPHAEAHFRRAREPASVRVFAAPAAARIVSAELFLRGDGAPVLKRLFVDGEEF